MSAQFEIAGSVRSRLAGLAAKHDFEGVLMLVPCCDIHTFTMTRPIDVAFVSAGGIVLESYRDVVPRKRIKCRDAAAVLERFAVGAPWFSAGDAVGIGRLEEGYARRRKL